MSATAETNIKKFTYHTEVKCSCHLQELRVETKRLFCIKEVFNGLLGPTVVVLNVCVVVLCTRHKSSAFKVSWGEVLCSSHNVWYVKYFICDMLGWGKKLMWKNKNTGTAKLAWGSFCSGWKHADTLNTHAGRRSLWKVRRVIYRN